MSTLHAQSSLSVAQDVRRLISQVEQGHAFDFEMTGHAYDVIGAASDTVTTRLYSTMLAQDIAHRVEHFAQAKGSAQMYLRLIITDVAPDLPAYDPSEVVIFDGVNGGTNFSTADVRFTNAGTIMTSVNITDLRAYFEAGRKRILVAYMGTDRDADAKANDRLSSLLPGMLATMGMEAKAIQQIIEAVKAGTMPVLVSKLLHQIAETARLKIALHTQPDNKDVQAKLALTEKQVVMLMTHVQSLPALPAVFARAFGPIKAAHIAVPAASPTVRTVTAGNDARSSLHAVHTLIQALRQATKDKSLPSEQRREIAAILRDLRAGVRLTNPAPARLVDGVLKLSALTVRVMSQPGRPVLYERIFPRAVSATLLLASSPFLAALRPGLSTILRDAPASPRMKAFIAQAGENGKAAEILVRFISRHPSRASSLAPLPLPQALQGMKTPEPSPQMKVFASPAIARNLATTPGRDTGFSLKPALQQVPATVPDIRPALSQTLPVERALTRGVPMDQKSAAPVMPAQDSTRQTPAADVAASGVTAGTDFLKQETAAQSTPAVIPQDKDNSGGLQYHSDGTLKDCCKTPFENAAALKEALQAKPHTHLDIQSVAPLPVLQFVAADGNVSAVTIQQVAENAAAHEAIHVRPMQDIRGNTLPDSPSAQNTWANDTLNLLKTTKSSESKVNLKFKHVCGDGCSHGQGFKATDPTTETTGKSVSNRDVDVQFVTVTPKPNENPLSKRPQRTMKPA